MLAERFSQDPLETYFCKQHPPGAWKDELLLYDFGCANTFRNQNVFKPIAAGKVKDENINFESHRTSSMSRKKYKHNNRCYFQKFQAAIRYLAINTTSKLNEYINKLTPAVAGRVLWIRVRPSVFPSFRPSVRKFSWDWLISFFWNSAWC